MTVPDPTPEVALAEIVGQTLREHQPTTGMAVTSGVTCRCGYWSGDEEAGKTRPVGYSGLQWHQAVEVAFRLAQRDARIKAEAGAEAIRSIAEDFEAEGFESVAAHLREQASEWEVRP